MATLPIPPQAAQLHSANLLSLIHQNIVQHQGWIDFASFMRMALYTPEWGYYSGGAQKFGVGGDFVTAPEISTLFAESLARQLIQILPSTQGQLVELGAGTGRLAADLLLTLSQLECLPSQYAILEVSAHLRHVQDEYLKRVLPSPIYQRVVWLETLPSAIHGCILANEVLDAIPVHLVYKRNGDWFERGVSWDGQLVWRDRPLDNAALLQQAMALVLPDDYLTELHPEAIALVNTLADGLQKGAILMMDYGFGANEYYHPQRHRGTLMCHYQHHAHDDPFMWVGLQDITSHVNFTAIAEAGLAHGMQVSYVNQASFLMNCGILELLARISPEHIGQYAPQVAAIQKLLSPAEMGELFKVIALTKGLSLPLRGFVSGDKRHTL